MESESIMDISAVDCNFSCIDDMHLPEFSMDVSRSKSNWYNFLKEEMHTSFNTKLSSENQKKKLHGYEERIRQIEMKFSTGLQEFECEKQKHEDLKSRSKIVEDELQLLCSEKTEVEKCENKNWKKIEEVRNQQERKLSEIEADSWGVNILREMTGVVWKYNPPNEIEGFVASGKHLKEAKTFKLNTEKLSQEFMRGYIWGLVDKVYSGNGWKDIGVPPLK